MHLFLDHPIVNSYFWNRSSTQVIDKISYFKNLYLHSPIAEVDDHDAVGVRSRLFVQGAVSYYVTYGQHKSNNLLF